MMLSDRLENQMKGTEWDSALNLLFEGEIESVVSCTNIAYESCQKELFTVLQVPLQESNTIEGAIKKLLQAENLTGEDQYFADQHGKQDAKKYLRIKRLPPVLQINLNRFGLSKEGDPSKINSRCEFEATLDMGSVIKSSDSYTLS